MIGAREQEGRRKQNQGPSGHTTSPKETRHTTDAEDVGEEKRIRGRCMEIREEARKRARGKEARD